MTTMAFDTLRYARQLRKAGVPEPQANVQAELMAEAFGFYAENLLTRDHFTEVLNARFSEQNAHIASLKDGMLQMQSSIDALTRATSRLQRIQFLHSWVLGFGFGVLLIFQISALIATA